MLVDFVRTDASKLSFKEIALPLYRYAIVEHRPRVSTPPLDNPPDTCPMGNSGDNPADDDKGTPIPISPEWWAFIKKINSEKGYAYARSVGKMWINTEYDEVSADPDPMPVAESIHCGGNYIAYDFETATHVRLAAHHWQSSTALLHPAADNWVNKPWMFWKACTIALDGTVRNVGNALDVYFPLIQKTELWIHKKYLEIFPLGYDYQFRGVNVYDGINPLLTVENGQRIFHTNWRIETKNVVPPLGWE